jgi:transcriptional regulator with XRE-family HTH domain
MKYWVGERLRLLRQANKLTQEHLGSVAGMCQSSVCKMEKGEEDPGFHAVLTMLRYMNAKVTDIVGEDGHPGKTEL